MKELYFDLQEKGRSDEEIRKIPDKVAWKMAEEMTKKEETLCGKPHNNGDDRPEVCSECMAIKLGI